MGAKGDTGTSTGALGKSNGQNPKDDLGRDITVPRLFYGSDSSQSLSTDNKDPAAKLPYDKEYRFLMQEWTTPPDCYPNGGLDLTGNKNPKCSYYSWWPYKIGVYDRQPVIRVIVVHGSGTETTYLYRDFPLDGVFHGTASDTAAVGYNFVLSGLSLKFGDRVELYFFDLGQKDAHGLPSVLNDKDWISFPSDKSDPKGSKAYSDFINITSVIYEGAFTSTPEMTKMPNSGATESFEKALLPKW